MKILKNFLDESLFEDLKEKFKNIESKKCYDEMIAGNYYSCLRFHCEDSVKYGPTEIEYELIEKLEDYLKNNLPKCNSLSVQFCIWYPKSELKMHFDSPYKFGATLYINNWNSEWGGLFQWKEKRSKQIKSFCPEENSLILNDIDEEHMVTKITSTLETRKCLQIWGK